MNSTTNDRFTRMEHNGKGLIYADYRDLGGEELVVQVKSNIALGMELASQGETEQLVLVDLRGCYINQDGVAALKEAATQAAPYVKASAVIGVEGLRKHLLEIVNKVSGYGAKPFGSIAEAKNWLASQ